MGGLVTFGLCLSGGLLSVGEGLTLGRLLATLVNPEEKKQRPEEQMNWLKTGAWEDLARRSIVNFTTRGLTSSAAPWPF